MEGDFCDVNRTAYLFILTTFIVAAVLHSPTNQSSKHLYVAIELM